VALVPLLLAVSCGLSSDVNKDPPTDEVEKKSYEKLAACRGSASDIEVQKHLEIATSFKESAHEMIICGGLVVSLAVGVIEVIVNEALGKSGRPDGLTFDGKGTYTSPQMDVRFYLGEDTSFGKAGDLVTLDLLDMATYLTGAKASGSAKLEGTTLKYDVKVAFTGVGPGVELLGLGAEPASPWQVDVDQVQASLKKLRVEANIRVKDTQAHADVTYDVDVPRTPLSAVIGGRQEMKLVAMGATRKDLGQSFTPLEFTIGYEDVGDHALDGIIRGNVSGGKVPFQVLYSYPRRAEPDVLLGCQGDKIEVPSSPAKD
jgi:hypothetical protein